MGLKKSLILNGAIGLVSAIATGINLAVLKKRFSKEQSQVQVNK